MSKIAVVYWSGTGNTEEMANAVAEGAKSTGAEVSVFTAGEFSADMADNFTAIAFGCPSMGSEQLEDSEFEPMFDAVSPKLKGKTIGLFGSYGWGDGEWMRNWAEQCSGLGCKMPRDFVICNDAPDDEAINACKALGEALSK